MAYNFDTIARTYDRLNRLMTLGLDRRWRKRALRGIQGNVLDVACGTGDMAVSLVERGCTVTGVDISEEMLAIARQKAPIVTFMIADAEHLPFHDASFDAVTCAFGVRNFVHLEQGLSEMLRVLKPGGRMVILELATPDSSLIRPFYNLYTRRIIPWLGQRLAGSCEAYTYLPRSIERFPKGKEFLAILQRQGVRATERKITFGVCRMYVVDKEAARG
ncbi:MAG: bifunctional demethylmenaquinone methyltransferase/2-methoxy-6-polyprenyl-1,4-benzoquinol methylase UbiE [Bacteroidales bacterium]|nr:bifunctional demethylmenaquinone methyltransferase/2-methoxy-6-polyprenyl-1,4-benzoquinol methylase UbiE [Bacteroidales bacterium]